MNTKIKLGIAGVVIILLLIMVPDVFSDVFHIVKDTAIACDKAARDVELPKVDTYK